MPIPPGEPMAISRTSTERHERPTWQHHRLTIASALTALAGGSVVLANFAGAAGGASAVDYAQCTNGGPSSSAITGCVSWINGILNANNSQYREDDATPQRLIVSFP